MYNRSQRLPQVKNGLGKRKFQIKQSTSKNIWPVSQDTQRTPSHSDFLRFLARRLLLSCQRALDAIDPLPLIDGELLVTCDNGAVERITPSQFFLFLTHDANDDLINAARRYLESSDPETANIVEHANHTHHAVFQQLKADQGGG
jgi:hypothetical protein